MRKLSLLDRISNIGKEIIKIDSFNNDNWHKVSFYIKPMKIKRGYSKKGFWIDEFLIRECYPQPKDLHHIGA